MQPKKWWNKQEEMKQLDAVNYRTKNSLSPKYNKQWTLCVARFVDIVDGAAKICIGSKFSWEKPGSNLAGLTPVTENIEVLQWLYSGV
jgi:hypothetical protein